MFMMIRVMVECYSEEVKDRILREIEKLFNDNNLVVSNLHLYFNAPYWKFPDLMECIFMLEVKEDFSIELFTNFFNLNFLIEEYQTQDSYTDEQFDEKSAIWSRHAMEGEFLIKEIEWAHIYNWPESHVVHNKICKTENLPPFEDIPYIPLEQEFAQEEIVGFIKNGKKCFYDRFKNLWTPYTFDDHGIPIEWEVTLTSLGKEKFKFNVKLDETVVLVNSLGKRLDDDEEPQIMASVNMKGELTHVKEVKKSKK